MLRRVLFWSHLVIGVGAGLVILIMSLTGVLLTYEKQILAWTDREFRSASVPDNAMRLPIGHLVEKLRDAGNGEAAPASMTFYSGSRFVAASMGGNGQGGARGGATRYVDAYSGDVKSPESDQARGFFRSVTNWHRTLAAPQGYREVGSAVTGAANLMFVLLALSGLFIWWPRNRSFRPITWFRGGLRGKARNWNWHNVFGVWAAVPLFLIALSGVVISYSWASNLVYRITGTEPPARQGDQRADGQAPRGRGGSQAALGAEPATRGNDGNRSLVQNRAEGQVQRRDRDRARVAADAETPEAQAEVGDNRRAGERRGEGRPRREREGAPGPSGTEMPATLDYLDPLLTRVQTEVPDWQTIALRLPNSPDAPVVFTVDQGNGGQPQYRSTLTLDRAGAIIKRETFADQNAGRQARSWLRYIHTGEYYGVFGQTIAGLASFAGVMLVWTGLSLALRRFLAWARPRRERERVAGLAVPPQTAAEER